VIQRCQAHKCRNVANKLPDDLAKTVTKKMRAAYHAPSAIIAEAQLELDGAAGESLSQPSVAVSGTGTTAVSFYRTNPFTGIAVGGGTFGYGLRARPAGGSFGAYRPLSDGQDYPSPQANASQAGFLGDYSSIAASTAPGSDLVHAVWSDTRNISSAGPDEDIFMATVSL